jgi:lipoate-protein ligase A
MTTVWHFEFSGNRTGSFNMQHDEELARRLLRAEGGPTLRLYGWSPPSISIGWNQSPDSINVDAAYRAGIDVVRRPTGGRAILHSDELTYCVVMPAEGKSISEVYRSISQALVAGLAELGVEAVVERSQPHFPSLYKSSSGVACFSSSARHEITVNGRKLVGSAQRRFTGPAGDVVALQHGSILLGPDHKRIVQFTRTRNDEDRRVLREELEARTTDLTAVLGNRPATDRLVRALRFGFERAWGICFADEVGVPTEESEFMP